MAWNLARVDMTTKQRLIKLEKVGLLMIKKCSSPDVEIFKMTFSIFLGRYLNSYLWKLKMALLKEFDEINLEEQNKNILRFVKCKVA